MNGYSNGGPDMPPEDKARILTMRILLTKLDVPFIIKKNIIQLYGTLKEGEAFGRPETMEILGRALTTVSSILGSMKDLGLLVRAEDAGRGKYRFREFTEEEKAWDWNQPGKRL